MELQVIQNKIYEIRGQRVMLDRDLAELYGVTTSALNQAVKRNKERFPDDFMFQLTLDECSRCQIGTLYERGEKSLNWSTYRPYAFTENGVAADARVCAATVDFCGTDMYTLASEIDKISYLVLARGRRAVMEEDIREAACATEEFDSFALANAILARNIPTALAVLDKMKAEKAEPVRIMAELIRVICDMNTILACQKAGMSQNDIAAATGIKPYPLAKYIAAMKNIGADALEKTLALCVAADAQTKGWGRGYVPIEQLICSI